MSVFDDDFIEAFDEGCRQREAQEACLLFKEPFSKVCDAFLFYSLPGFTTDVPPECRYLDSKGCFVPNFYMVNPFYYLGREDCLVKDGTLFLKIDENDDPENLYINLGKYIQMDIPESMPVVLFRRFPKRKYINRLGVISDNVDDDVIIQFRDSDGNGIDGLFEFIGVFKAERKEPAEENIYKMTKIFDRYYFNDDKILK